MTAKVVSLDPHPTAHTRRWVNLWVAFGTMGGQTVSSTPLSPGDTRTIAQMMADGYDLLAGNDVFSTAQLADIRSRNAACNVVFYAVPGATDNFGHPPSINDDVSHPKSFYMFDGPDISTTTQSVTSCENFSASADTGEITLAAVHGRVVGDPVSLSGCSVAGWNRTDFRVVTVISTTRLKVRSDGDWTSGADSTGGTMTKFVDSVIASDPGTVGTYVMRTWEPRWQAVLTSAAAAEGFPYQTTLADNDAAMPDSMGRYAPSQWSANGGANPDPWDPSGGTLSEREWLLLNCDLLANVRTAMGMHADGVHVRPLFANFLKDGPAFYSLTTAGADDTEYACTAIPLRSVHGATIENFIRNAPNGYNSFPAETEWKMNVQMLMDGGSNYLRRVVTGASGTGTTATLTVGPHAYWVGAKVTVTGMTPSGYNVTDAAVTAIGNTTISYASAESGAFSVGGIATGGGPKMMLAVTKFWPGLAEGSLTKSKQWYRFSFASFCLGNTSRLHYWGYTDGDPGYTTWEDATYVGANTTTDILPIAAQQVGRHWPYPKLFFESTDWIGTNVNLGLASETYSDIAGQKKAPATGAAWSAGAFYYSTLFSNGVVAVNPSSTVHTNAKIVGLVASATYTDIDGTTFVANGSGEVTIASMGANTGWVLSKV